MNYKFENKIHKVDIKKTGNYDIANFFSLHMHDNLYLFDEKKYIGFINRKIFINNPNSKLEDIVINPHINNFIDYIKSHKDIINFFEHNQDLEAAPILNQGELIGEFKLFNRYDYTFSTQKKLNGLKKLSIYEDLINDLLIIKNINKIGYLYPEYVEDIPSFIKKATFENIDDFDVVLDCYLPDEFIYLYGNSKKVINVDDFLSICFLNQFAKKNINNIYFVNEPVVDKEFLYPDELRNVNNENKLKYSLNDKEYFEKIYQDSKEDYEYINKLKTFVHQSAIVRNNGVYRYVSESVVEGDFKNQERITPSNTNEKKKIEIYGPCTAYSLFTSRFSSLSENMKIICKKRDLPLDVINLGVPSGGDFLNDIIKMIYEENDDQRIIIFINKFNKVVFDYIKECGFNNFYLTNAFKDAHYWFFNQNMHFNSKGNKLAANYIMNNININNCKEISFKDFRRQEIDNRYYLKEKDVDNYKNYLLKNKFKEKGKIGFIEVNASPLTKGHQHLIDYASKHCDYLYLFVTEDNQNALPFFDRFSMIERFCKQYNNIKVLSGSDFIGSQYTLSAYFNKQFNMKIDTKEDIRNFEEIIIPTLEIDCRFMGEEPNSELTNKINEEYYKFMNKIGKKLIIIPRLFVKENVVSASSVRKNLKSNNLEAVKEMVSDDVFNYLIQLNKKEITEG